MKRLLPIFAMVSAAGPCGTAHGAGMPPNGGTVAIQPRTADGEYDPSLAAYVDAAASALTDRGFTILDDPGHAAGTLELVLGRSRVGTALAKVPGQGAAMIGPGVVVPLSTGKSDVVPLQRIRLEMRLRERGETTTAWHGAAVTVRATGGPADTDRTATDLTQALLRSYPVTPSGDIPVP